MTSLPILSSDSGLIRYLEEIKKFPILSHEEEIMLATNLRDNGDLISAHKLVTSHLRLVAKIALSFKGYGLPMIDLISEGNIGLMQAVKRFDHEKGFRLATYAMWWIKASIQEYILKSWSLVKIGTTAAQKKLFYNLSKVKHNLSLAEKSDLSADDITAIANDLHVSEGEVMDMNSRLSYHDKYLNDQISFDGSGEMIDLIPEPSESHDITIGENQDKSQKMLRLQNAMLKLNDRERDIFKARKLQDEPATLDHLSKIYNISCERVRQIENRVMEKIQAEMTGSLG